MPNNLEVERLPTIGTVVTTPPYDLTVSAPTISSGLYSEPFTKTSGFIFFIKSRGVGVLKGTIKSTEL